MAVGASVPVLTWAPMVRGYHVCVQYHGPTDMLSGDVRPARYTASGEGHLVSANADPAQEWNTPAREQHADVLTAWVNDLRRPNADGTDIGRFSRVEKVTITPIVSMPEHDHHLYIVLVEGQIHID